MRCPNVFFQACFACKTPTTTIQLADWSSYFWQCNFYLATDEVLPIFMDCLYMDVKVAPLCEASGAIGIRTRVHWFRSRGIRVNNTMLKFEMASQLLDRRK